MFCRSSVCRCLCVGAKNTDLFSAVKLNILEIRDISYYVPWRPNRTALLNYEMQNSACYKSKQSIHVHDASVISVWMYLSVLLVSEAQ